MLSKAQHATAACSAGVPRVHVINGTLDEGLLGEVFSITALGRSIYANEYEHIRPAMRKDVRAIQMLTKQAARKRELLKRSKAGHRKEPGDYFIFEIDKNPVACVALHVYPRRTGELACLYVIHHTRIKASDVSYPVRGARGARSGPEGTAGAFDSSLYVFPSKGASSRGVRTTCRRRAGKGTSRGGDARRCC